MSFRKRTTTTNDLAKKQSAYSMMRSTDFGSKGMYKPTTSLAGGRASLENWIKHIENTQPDEWK